MPDYPNHSGLRPANFTTLRPLLSFVGDQLAEISGRPGKRGPTKVGETRLYLWDRQEPR